MQTVSVLLKLILLQLISFYSITVNDTKGNNIPFSSFAGKKVLIVNTCTKTADTAQYAGLEQLYQKYKDSLVIIAVPSNSFGNTPQNNTAINNFVQNRYSIHYLLASKLSVKAPDISPLYSWLTDITKNGMIADTVKKDFYKYLINTEGTLIGTFSNKVEPMNVLIQNAIEMP